MQGDLPPLDLEQLERIKQALRNLAEVFGGFTTCAIDGTNDMEAMAAAYNRWYAKARPLPLFADGRAYRRRCLARRRRR